MELLNEPKILTIERAKWRRGSIGHGESLLLNDQGFMCCLGFDAIACGLAPGTIKDVGRPDELFAVLPDTYTSHRLYRDDEDDDDDDTVLWADEPAITEAISINDDVDLDEDEREHKLRGILKKLGWDDVVFV